MKGLILMTTETYYTSVTQNGINSII